MNRLATIILGAGLVLIPTAFKLPAQSGAQFGNLPLWFETTGPGKFIAHGSQSEFMVTATGAEFSLTKGSGETASGSLQFIGANPAARISGDQPLMGKINYLVGNDPGQWQANRPTFSQIRVEDVYPGVNVVYYGNRQKLEYDFNLAAGVNPSVIALRFAGAERISLNSQGELVIKFKAGEIIQHAPVAYQTIHGRRQEVVAGYQILDRHTATLALGDYDRSQPLVIDPVLSYSTYYGGNYGETGRSIAVNPTDGSVYVAGQTYSTKSTNSIPFATPGSLQTTNHGGKLTGDAFIARFDNTGTNLIYATYLGGSGNDGILGLAVDSAGNAFLTGFTDSTNFPTTNAIYPSISGVIPKNGKTYPVDVFVTELNPDGNGLIYSTYLGGSSMDAAWGIALDGSDNAYITGYTYSTDFPVTTNTAFQSQLACSNTFYLNANAFIAEIAAGGTNLSYSSYLGGTNFDTGRSIAYNNGRIFVAGYTFSTNFPSINCLPGNELLNGDTSTNSTKKKKKRIVFPDAFVTAFDVSNLSVPLYSTFLGGTNNDAANSIAADASGNAYVAGFTCSTNFPYTTTNVPDLTAAFVHTNDFKKHYALATNGFLTQIKWDGVQPSLGYSTMFGGKGLNVANGVALDPAGNAYVVGTATCTNFPATTNNISGFLSATNSSKKNKRYSDAIVIAFNADASALLYSAYIGGRERDYGNAIAVDPLGDAYIVGQTLSTNFPAVNAYQPRRSGTNDMFIAKISLQPLTNAVANFTASPDSGPAPLTVQFTDLSSGPVTAWSWDFGDGNTSTSQNPLHTYNSATNFVAQLTVTGINGQTSAMVRTITATNAPAPVPTLFIEPQALSAPAQSKTAQIAPATPPGLILKWQNASANYDIESSTELNSGHWQVVPQRPVLSNGWNQITLPTTNSSQFFRLRQR